MNVIERSVDVLVIGGGTAGPMAAVKAKQADPRLEVLLLLPEPVAAALRPSPFGLSLSKPLPPWHRPFDKLRASGVEGCA